VRRSPATAIAVSIGVHAAAIAGIQLQPRHPRAPIAAPAAPPSTAPEPRRGPEPEPIAVVFLGDAAVEVRGTADLARRAPGDPVPSRRRRAALSTSASHPGTEVGRPGVDPPPTPAPARVPHSTDLPGHFIDDFLASSKPLAPRPDIPGERIGDEIDAQRARLRDATTADEAMAARADLVALYDQRDAEELRPAGGGTYESDQGAYRAHVAADGTVHLEDAPNLQVHGLSGSFDVTDWAMRSHGQDPYAGQKLRFLERTLEQRVAIGRRHRTRQLARSAELARHNVDRLLAITPDLDERKRGLFELWDDCAESGDDELVRGGAAARALILGVIRAELAGTDAYTADELVRFNARRTSTAAFAPYE